MPKIGWVAVALSAACATGEPLDSVSSGGSGPGGGAQGGSSATVESCDVGTPCGALCVDLRTDPSNCGSCGRSCVLPNGEAACAQAPLPQPSPARAEEGEGGSATPPPLRGSDGAEVAPKRARRRLAIAIAAATAIVIAAVAADRAFPPPLERAAPRSVVVAGADGAMLRPFANAEGRWRLPTTVEDVDPRYLRLLIAIEDSRFHQHVGVDPLAVARAAVQLAANGRIVSGASTLTMQTARLLEPRPRGILTKLAQAARALQLETRLTKSAILDLYPTGMADTLLCNYVERCCRSNEVGYLALLLDDFEVAVVQQCSSGAVVAPVFQSLQPFDDNGPGFTAPDVAYNSTHVSTFGECHFDAHFVLGVFGAGKNNATTALCLIDNLEVHDVASAALGHITELGRNIHPVAVGFTICPSDENASENRYAIVGGKDKVRDGCRRQSSIRHSEIYVRIVDKSCESSPGKAITGIL